MGTSTHQSRNSQRKQAGGAKQPVMKTCPDCAERVQSAARKCRFCGFRFEPLVEVSSINEAAVTAPIQTVSVSGRTVRRSGTVKTGATAASVGEASSSVDALKSKSTESFVARSIASVKAHPARAWIALAVVVALVCVASFVVWQRHAAGVKLETQATESAEAISEVASVIDDTDVARPNRSAQAIRDAVKETSASLDDRIQDASRLSATDTSRALRQQLTAEKALNEEVARVLALPASKATPVELAGLTAAASALNSASAKLGALLPAQAKSVDAAVDTAPLTRLMTSANTRYRRETVRAQRARNRVRQQNARRRQSLRSTETYAAGFSGILSRYTESRNDLQEWIDSVRTGGATYGEAYQVLEQQASRRTQLRSEFAGLTPPPELATEHARVIRVIDRAIDATQAASLGISEYQYDATGEYFYFEQAPSWQRFQSESASIAKEYTVATSSWAAARKRLTARLNKQTAMPPMPKDQRL